MASGSLSYWSFRETGPREAMTALFTVPKERFFSKKHIKFKKMFLALLLWNFSPGVNSCFCSTVLCHQYVIRFSYVILLSFSSLLFSLFSTKCRNCNFFPHGFCCGTVRVSELAFMFTFLFENFLVFFY